MCTKLIFQWFNIFSHQNKEKDSEITPFCLKNTLKNGSANVRYYYSALMAYYTQKDTFFIQNSAKTYLTQESNNLWVSTSILKEHFNAGRPPISCIFLFLQFFCDRKDGKIWKRWFGPANGSKSTHWLAETHNTCLSLFWSRQFIEMSHFVTHKISSQKSKINLLTVLLLQFLNLSLDTPQFVFRNIIIWLSFIIYFSL